MSESERLPRATRGPASPHRLDVTIGHSAAWSWDGEVLVFGHEPGGGTQARCQATSAVVDRTLFFYDDEGNQLGSFLHRGRRDRRRTAPGTTTTWCRPTRAGSGLGQLPVRHQRVRLHRSDGRQEIAFADPAQLVNPDNAAAIEGGGDWSSYWYDGRIYESDMTRGLTIWNLSDNAVAGAKKLGRYG